MAGESSVTLLIIFIAISKGCVLLGCVGNRGELSDSVECGEMGGCQYLESWDGEGK